MGGCGGKMWMWMFCAGGEGGDGLAIMRECLCWGGAKNGGEGLFGEGSAVLISNGARGGKGASLGFSEVERE